MDRDSYEPDKQPLRKAYVARHAHDLGGFPLGETDLTIIAPIRGQASRFDYQRGDVERFRRVGWEAAGVPARTGVRELWSCRGLSESALG